MTVTPTPAPADSPFIVFPAVDLRGGQVVRLAQGDPGLQTVYADDAAAVARRWQSEGAEWVHVVNLDAAFGQDSGANARALSPVAALGLKVQFGGGLRDRASLERAIAAGVTRLVIGTAAVEQPALVDWALATYGSERVAVGIDAREGQVRVRGWSEAGGLSALELAQRLRAQGVEWCVFTDVARDGLQTGVNVAATVAIAQATGLRVIASGGVAGLEDVQRVREAGLAGVIIGRALYEGHIQLKEVFDDRNRGLQGR